jgi:hypothetical protein
VSASEGAITGKLAASALAAMNPHYHPYGAPELTSPHPPSPDNNNYHGHPGPGGPQLRMHQSNGHGIGPLGKLQTIRLIIKKDLKQSIYFLESSLLREINQKLLFATF